MVLNGAREFSDVWKGVMSRSCVLTITTRKNRRAMVALGLDWPVQLGITSRYGHFSAKRLIDGRSDAKDTGSGLFRGWFLCLTGGAL